MLFLTSLEDEHSPKFRRKARTLSVKVQALAMREPDDFAAAFSAMTRRRPDAILLVADGLTTMNRKRFVEFAATHRIPAMYEWNFIVREGGLMSYGVSMEDSFRQGASPADLPAEQPTRYYLAVSRKMATTLGLTIPPTLLLRTDEVVE